MSPSFEMFRHKTMRKVTLRSPLLAMLDAHFYAREKIRDGMGRGLPGAWH